MITDMYRGVKIIRPFFPPTQIVFRFRANTRYLHTVLAFVKKG